jgi:hypothetical protein
MACVRPRAMRHERCERDERRAQSTYPRSAPCSTYRSSFVHTLTAMNQPLPSQGSKETPVEFDLALLVIAWCGHTICLPNARLSVVELTQRYDSQACPQTMSVAAARAPSPGALYAQRAAGRRWGTRDGVLGAGVLGQRGRAGVLVCTGTPSHRWRRFRIHSDGDSLSRRWAAGRVLAATPSKAHTTLLVDTYPGAMHVNTLLPSAGLKHRLFHDFLNSSHGRRGACAVAASSSSDVRGLLPAELSHTGVRQYSPQQLAYLGDGVWLRWLSVGIRRSQICRWSVPNAFATRLISPMGTT